MQVSSAPRAARVRIGLVASQTLAATGMAAARPARMPSTTLMARRFRPVARRVGSAPGLREEPRCLMRRG